MKKSNPLKRVTFCVVYTQNTMSSAGFLHDKARDMELLKKENVINLFVEFSGKVDQLIGEMHKEIRVLKEELNQLKNVKNSRVLPQYKAVHPLRADTRVAGVHL